MTGMLGSVCLLAVMSALCCLPANAWVYPGVSTDKSSYMPGEEIRVNFSGAPGASGDWICIVRAGASDTNSGNYKYLPTGAEQGYLTFTAPRPGDYEVRAYYNYRRNGYVVAARHSFTVAGQWSSHEVRHHREHFTRYDLLDTDKTTYSPGEKIQVRFSGAPGAARDWICIVRAGAPDTDAGDYQYLPAGAEQGYLSFTAPGPGTYEVRAYYNYQWNSHEVTARHRFNVAGRSSSFVPQVNHSDPVLRQVQNALIMKGYDPGEADGMYGDKTEKAIREFQRDNHLRETGTLNHRTMKALGLLDETPQR